jgi:hypothetical protein
MARLQVSDILVLNQLTMKACLAKLKQQGRNGQVTLSAQHAQWCGQGECLISPGAVEGMNMDNMDPYAAPVTACCIA